MLFDLFSKLGLEKNGHRHMSDDVGLKTKDTYDVDVSATEVNSRSLLETWREPLGVGGAAQPPVYCHKWISGRSVYMDLIRVELGTPFA